MGDPNVIRIVHKPGIILELRTAVPLPAGGYEQLGKVAQAAADLATLLQPAEETSGA